MEAAREDSRETASGEQAGIELRSALLLLGVGSPGPRAARSRAAGPAPPACPASAPRRRRARPPARPPPARPRTCAIFLICFMRFFLWLDRYSSFL